MPSQQLLTEMGKFNEELVNAGIMLGGDGLHPSSKGARVRFAGSKVTVIDGPFAETKELIAGYWLWKVKSLQEAIDWVKRMPNPDNYPEGEIEIRPVFEMDDFGPEFTPQLREQEERVLAKAAHDASRGRFHPRLTSPAGEHTLSNRWSSLCRRSAHVCGLTTKVKRRRAFTFRSSRIPRS